MVLYLNFDGVLHPNRVTFSASGAPQLEIPRHHLFENSNVLARVLFDFPDVRVVLNTWWTYRFSIAECVARLPETVRQRVDGAVLPHSNLCPVLPDRIEFVAHALARETQPALILDHADSRYPRHLLSRALLLDPETGLCDGHTSEALSRLLARKAI
ncbi:HAD domain-containing protein [Paraburkholderia terrae]|uniref:HAD domain-containing protein n=1 Tax=Paraburkholderia terrae TaxID=311230 RepID=UPI00296B23DB|nr:HAD domain-containing protein [Paraburkholderia terrae]MDW3663258.1 HAD domain-containing protein [Paraburkholderia terrae]